MNDKKNLDRLFQEKFKDFEVEPDIQVWKNIESALKEKEKKKRVIPIWFRLSGVAAAFLIGGLIWYSAFDTDSIPTQNGIVTKDSNQKLIDNSTGVAIEEKQGKSIQTQPENQLPSSNNSVSNIPVDAKSDRTINRSDALTAAGKKTSVQAKEVITSEENQNSIAIQNRKKARRNSKKNGVVPYRETSIAQTTKNLKTDANGFEIGKSAENSTEKSVAVSGNNSENTAGNSSDKNSFTKQTTTIADNQIEQKNTVINPANATISKSSTDIISDADVKKLDSTAIATVPNALEELLKENEKEKIVIAETKLNRWQVMPQVAPIYFGSTANGSPIDPEFSGNDKTYDRNMSYGVALNYAVNKKLNVRTGVNKLTLGYNTNDVSFSAGLNGRGFETISSVGNSAGIQIVSADISSSLLPFENNLQNIKTGYISQSMGYIEVPMELSYKLIDRKFGINLIGGLSTLFLDENNISISSTDVSTSLGEATNLNDIHFSSNFGIGFKYSFLKSFEFNFEPTLKYQINTFSRNAGDFKPYFIGLYSGLSFKF